MNTPVDPTAALSRSPRLLKLLVWALPAAIAGACWPIDRWLHRNDWPRT